MEADVRRPRGRRRRGVTLVELMVAIGLSGFILSAILGSFLFVTKGGIRLAAFYDMETRGALAVQRFSIDARQSSGVTWSGAHELTLALAPADWITYTYDSAGGTLARTTPAGTRVITTDIASFRFVPFDRDGNAIDVNSGNVNSRTKMVQMEMRCRKLGSSTTATARSDLISARYVLRNKASN